MPMIVDDPTQWGAAPLARAWELFNVNETVRVKLTDIGVAEYRRQIEELNAKLPDTATPFPTAPKLDDDGFYRTQLWSLMQEFGHLMHCGAHVPFETEIQLDRSGVRHLP